LNFKLAFNAAIHFIKGKEVLNFLPKASKTTLLYTILEFGENLSNVVTVTLKIIFSFFSKTPPMAAP